MAAGDEAHGDARRIHLGKQEVHRLRSRRRRRLEAMNPRRAVAALRLRVKRHLEEAAERWPQAKVDDRHGLSAIIYFGALSSILVCSAVERMRATSEVRNSFNSCGVLDVGSSPRVSSLLLISGDSIALTNAS